MCPTNDSIEGAARFLLLCPSFYVQRRDIHARVTDLLLPFGEIENLSKDLPDRSG